MAQALGADLAHMDATEVMIMCDPQLMARGILVNARGQQFVPEDTYPGRIGQQVLLRNDNQAYLVLDEAGAGQEARMDSTDRRANRGHRLARPNRWLPVGRATHQR